jgi:hypothetical protein
MKKEFLNPEPVKIKVQDIKGEIHELEKKNVSLAELDKMWKAVKENDTNMKVYGIQLAVHYGTPENFWNNFSARVLKDLLKETNEAMSDPT